MKRILVGLAMLMISGSVLADIVLVCSGTVTLTTDVHPQPEYVQKNFTVKLTKNIWGSVIDADVTGDVSGLYMPDNRITDNELIVQDGYYVLQNREFNLGIDRHSLRFTYHSQSNVSPYRLKAEGSGQCRESSGKI